MGRPKKIKDNPVVDVVIEKVDDSEVKEERELASGHVLTCNSLKTFGIIFKRGYVELYERTYFKEPTTINAGTRTFYYKAGDYSPWRYSSRPYPATWERALELVSDWMSQDELSEKTNLKATVKIITETKKEIINSLKESINEYLSKIELTK